MPWEIEEERVVIEHPYLRVHFERVRLPDGQVIPDWPRVHAGNYVNAFVQNEDDEVLVLAGYKHGIGRVSWQIVGGYIEDGEEALTTVQRELREETGLEAPIWESLGDFVVDANRHVGTGHLFLARGARQVAAPARDDLEAVEILWVSLDDPLLL